jgi:hypothetical protein
MERRERKSIMVKAWRSRRPKCKERRKSRRARRKCTYIGKYYGDLKMKNKQNRTKRVGEENMKAQELEKQEQKEELRGEIGGRFIVGKGKWEQFQEIFCASVSVCYMVLQMLRFGREVSQSADG